jgi:tetratricopeptide (TPR) repeat protein
MWQDAIKSGEEALTFEAHNPKAHYRLYSAYRTLNNLDKAKDHLETAITQSPQDLTLRKEHKNFIYVKNKKERAWQVKMSGFYGGKKLTKIETQDEEEAVLRSKIER